MRNACLMMSVLAICAVGPAAAAPEESGFYVGIGGAASEYSAGREDVLAARLAVLPSVIAVPPRDVPAIVPLSQVPAGTAATPFVNRLFDRSDRALSFTAGYVFNRYLNLEVSYTDLGELSSQRLAQLPSDSDGPGPQNQVDIDQKVEVRSLSLSALATLPITERFKVFARGGYAFSQVDSDLLVTLTQFNGVMRPASVQARSSDDSDSNGVVFGAGASFDVFRGWTVRADFTKVLDAGGDAFLRETDIESYGLSLLYSF